MAKNNNRFIKKKLRFVVMTWKKTKSLTTSTQMHIFLDSLKVDSQKPTKGYGKPKKALTLPQIN